MSKPALCATSSASPTNVNFIRGVIYIVFTMLRGIDLNEVHTLIEMGIAVAAVLAALLLFDPLVEILLMASLIALVVAVARGQCSNPTIESGIRACVTTWGGVAFYAIIDVIHRLLALIPHAIPPSCPFD